MKRGTTFSAEGLFVKVIASPDSRFHTGVIISKKVGKTAVIRHHLRRVVYNTLRVLAPEKPIMMLCTISKIPGSDQELSQSIETLCKKILSAS